MSNRVWKTGTVLDFPLEPMGYQPKTEDYERTKNAVTRIFEAGAR
jgi:hypothetical protein